MPPKNLHPYRLTTPDRITVCTRPFRAAGPRIEQVSLGDTHLLVHNYGHGGSGWSLSWGSAEAAVSTLLHGTDPTREQIAVIGAGAIGLTSALVAQRAGARVTIYTRDLPAESRSARATGAWTPDSRIALASAVTPAFVTRWEALARRSWHAFTPYLNASGTPIEFQPRYTLCGALPPDTYQQKLHAGDTLAFAWLNPSLADLYQPPVDYPPSTNSPILPFCAEAQHIRCEQQLTFNLTEYIRQLVDEFHRAGGRMVRREFHTPAELTSLAERRILHATGYGARALFDDQTLTPVRGQITWLPAQREAPYSLFTGDSHQHLNLVSRRDGFVVQWSAAGESTGWNVSDETPNQQESTAALTQLRALLNHKS